MNDALTYHHILSELALLENGRIDKINMPNKTDVYFTVKCGKQTHTLIASCDPSRPRLHLTDKKTENPTTPFAFLMHLRKHLSSAIINKIEQLPFERVVVFTLSAKNSLFFEQTMRLYVEIMGKYSNVILTDENGAITESAIHVTADTSSKRMVLPGLPYFPPPSQNGKITIEDEDEFVKRALAYDGKVAAHNYIVSFLVGLAPATLREAVLRSGFRHPVTPEIAYRLRETILSFYHEYRPCYVKRGNKITDFYPFFYQTEGELVESDTLCRAMDAYYGSQSAAVSKNEGLKAIETAVKTAALRNEKKIEGLTERIRQASDCETDRILGELVTANIYKLRYGDKSVTVWNYYADETVEIALDPLLSPAENAQKYYKRYNKKKRTVETSEELLQKAKETAEYLESLAVAASQASTEADCKDLIREMTASGLISSKKTSKPTKPATGPRKYLIDGVTVLVGKNNLQNDELVRNSDGGFTWLHTKDIHGSHVIVQSKAPSPSLLAKAAQIAAFYSKASMSDNVPVDYTSVKHVKKPSGALPGRVIYTNQRTIYVTPKNPEN